MPLLVNRCEVHDMAPRTNTTFADTETRATPYMCAGTETGRDIHMLVLDLTHARKTPNWEPPHWPVAYRVLACVLGTR